jgi:hypothetical protein
MYRRFFLACVAPVFGRLAAWAASVPGLSIRGTLIQNANKKPVLELADHKRVALDGDAGSLSVMNDKRLAGVDFEAVGHFETPDRFVVDPIQTKAMFVYKNGKKSYITYWCDVCYIRTYTPGACWCCQKYTDLDLQPAGEP